MGQGKILITGGAGYIGSHVVKQLGELGEQLIVLDNLATGFRSAVLYGEFVEGDVGDRKLVSRLLRAHAIDTIMHFAASTIVPESVAEPLKYYANNTCASRNLLDCAIDAGVRQFVFSSTAAVYGVGEGGLMAEDSPTRPINPYGMSKLMTEWILQDVSVAHDFRYVALRYFNVAGCDTDGRIGQSTPGATLLTKVACEAAVGKRDKVYIFGTDYDTPDGTGIRDFIHVDDLARAHVDALTYLRAGGESQVLNCGYGRGYSVREVLRAVEQASGCRLPVEEAPRRAGDPPVLVASADRIGKVLNWKPRLDDLDKIVQSSLEWERQLLQRPVA